MQRDGYLLSGILYKNFISKSNTTYIEEWSQASADDVNEQLDISDM